MTAIRIERDGDVAVIVIDNPPINAGSKDVRQGLQDAIHAIDADHTIVAAVLIGDHGTFIAGSDIREFGGPLVSPELPAVIAAIERSGKPFVAALSGAALGGGYELALGCDRRIATPGTVIGLPEVTLGMIPGAGGTQRLPRLTGMVRAAELICRGERIEARAAAGIGMIDRVVEGDLRGEAVADARAMAGRKARVIDRPVPPFDPAAFDEQAATLIKAGRGRPGVVAAIASLRDAVTDDAATALAAERARFTELRLGPDAAALRHLFFAERAAGRGPRGIETRVIARAAVVGAGTMGAGIAAALIGAGCAVTLVDSNAEALGRAQAVIGGAIAHWRKTGRLDHAQAGRAEAALTTSATLAVVAGCDLVIEAIVEDLAAKRALFAEVAGIVGEYAIIASNTSYLDLEALAVIPRPERIIGLHFFNPPHVMRLLEIVVTSRTDDATLAAALALAKRMGKVAVAANVGPGFIGNRIYAAYRQQCEIMIEDGAWPEQVDAALEGFGFAMGPFATGDLSGLDIAWAMRRAQAPTRDPAHRYVAIPDRLCERGWIGRKAGRGYYRYDEGGRRGRPDPEVRAIIAAESSANGIVRRAFTDDEIVARVMAAIVNTAALVVEEKVARQASDVDVVMVHGYGFPRHVGGPVWWAARQSRAEIHRAIDAVAAATGPGFRRGDVDRLLDSMDAA